MNLGEKGELLAKFYLEKKGYTILEQNFRTRYGEIDIIAKFQGEIIFFEVKTRSSMDYGLPCEAVNKSKQRKIHGVANFYLLTAGCDCSKCRIDIIEILIINKKPFIRQISNVF
ncbi:MAG: YraN family protein [Peptostreptococcaceae bacterium]|nr:YraN family protein [Peptostreptococcaceae bacterium]